MQDTTDTVRDAYYRRHIFFCLNQRAPGEACCADFPAREGFEQCKRLVRDLGLAGVGGVRVNKAGCLEIWYCCDV